MTSEESIETRTLAWTRLRWLTLVGWLVAGALGCTTPAVTKDGSDGPPSDAVADLAVAPARDLAPPADLASAHFRDWRAFPSVVELDTSADIFAVSDVHGDYDRLVALLASQRIIAAVPTTAENVSWVAGSAVLVVVGDVIDKWNQGLKVIALLTALRDGAKAAGGQVVVTLGNHEAEFLADPTAMTTREFVAELTAAGIPPVDVAAGRHPVGLYLRSLPVAARVRDWFFSHAGNSAGRTMAQLKNDIETGMDLQGFAAPVLLGDSSILEARLSPTPWWESTGDPAGTLAQYTKALSVAHLVMGHQPGKYTFADGATRSKGTIFAQLGMAFLIDAGMSQGVDYSKGALLKIEKTGPQTTATAIYADGTSKRVFP
jgi:hypothetical protein